MTFASVVARVSKQKAVSVFCSYAHADWKYRDQLQEHLGFLTKAGQVEFWHDRRIRPGADWGREISDHLNCADIILFLVSSAFADSQYCWDVEVVRALERHEEGSALVIPIIIRPVDGWDDTPLGRLQALPTDAKPVSLWRPRDKAYADIVAGLRDIIRRRSGEEITAHMPEWVEWTLTLPEGSESLTEVGIRTLAVRLRQAANSEKLKYLAAGTASETLRFRSTPQVFETLKRLHAEGTLQSALGCSIRSLAPAIGAVLRIESRIEESTCGVATHYVPGDFGGHVLEGGSPPIVGGISFPMANPLQIGFSLLVDPSAPALSLEDQGKLQIRLGRYLNTILVLKGDLLQVTLNPMDDFCGLPQELRNTELGRDLLAQDLVLKYCIASQLYPETSHGKAFWEVADALSLDVSSIGTCLRVWIVPASASVRETQQDGHGHVAIERLGLTVLCASDYDSHRGAEHRLLGGSADLDASAHSEQLLGAFREHILPVIQHEVSVGPRFGPLRQILSVLTIAKWMMESDFGNLLKRTTFFGSNQPEKYGLNTVNDEEVFSLKQLYLRSFREGAWRSTRSSIDPERSTAQTRLYVVGGIDLLVGRRK